MDFLGLGPPEVLVILVLALIVLGPQRIVSVAVSLGKAVREFRKATTQLSDQLTRDVLQEEAGPPPARGEPAPPPGSRGRKPSSPPGPDQPPGPER
ncbi:MAG: twin-arginine translocase TatA/TatE family subunit [Chloroflexi bacterium]|nr:twin-arginine translocase TatA/TatE family subunit [Chloroflexota bacterium]